MEDKIIMINLENNQMIHEIKLKSSTMQVLQVTIEELAELQQVSVKALRSITNDQTLRVADDNIDIVLKEEIADSYIMLEQLKSKIGLTNEELNKIIYRKCTKTLEILNERNKIRRK